MFLVAMLSSLPDDGGDRASLLATVTGQTAYEARLLLADEPPWVVLRTPERERARTVALQLKAAGADVVAFAASAVRSFADMIAVTEASEGGLAADDGRVLAWGQVACLIRLTMRRTFETTKKETKRQLAIGMAIATGGVILSKKVQKEHIERHEDREQFLCAFQRDGDAWLAAESDVDGRGLPGGAGLTQAETFERFVEHVRRRIAAPYDDRFLRAKRPANDRAAVRQLEERVHVLALALSRRA